MEQYLTIGISAAGAVANKFTQMAANFLCRLLIQKVQTYIEEN